MKSLARIILLLALLVPLHGNAVAASQDQGVVEDVSYKLADDYWNVTGWFRNTGNQEALFLVRCTFYNKDRDVIHQARISVLGVLAPVPAHTRAPFEYAIHKSRVPGLDSVECVPLP